MFTQFDAFEVSLNIPSGEFLNSSMTLTQVPKSWQPYVEYKSASLIETAQITRIFNAIKLSKKTNSYWSMCFYKEMQKVKPISLALDLVSDINFRILYVATRH